MYEYEDDFGSWTHYAQLHPQAQLRVSLRALCWSCVCLGRDDDVLCRGWHWEDKGDGDGSDSRIVLQVTVGSEEHDWCAWVQDATP